MDFWYIILIGLLLFAILFVIYMLWLNITARRQGLRFIWNPFTSVSGSRRYSVAPRTGGLIGWVNDKIREWRYKRNRSAAGAYEGQALGRYNSGRQGERGRGLDPDDAWDARVGAEADVDPYNPNDGYYEEELGLQDTTYKGGELESGRGRQMSREHEGPMSGGNQAGLDARYKQETGITQSDGAGVGLSQNPFDDSNAASPLPPPPGDSSSPTKGQESLGVNSPDTERRSLFKEDMV